ncbi:hypothetical protein G6F68_020869 [Rhizopus microsporus]|nr:hypothetical protein G6F68_020869 [Rhizopus microsporus]
MDENVLRVVCESVAVGRIAAMVDTRRILCTFCCFSSGAKVPLAHILATISGLTFQTKIVLSEQVLTTLKPFSSALVRMNLTAVICSA